MKKFLVVSSVLLSLLLLQACESADDPKAANEKNFSKAVTEFLKDTKPLTFTIFQIHFPKYVAEGYANYNTLLVLEKYKIVQAITQGQSTNYSNQTVKNYTFDLTEEGKKFYKNVNGWHTLVFGKPKFKSIVKWEEPTDNKTTVTFKYVVEEIPEWAKDKDIWEKDSSHISLRSEKDRLKEYVNGKEKEGRVTLVRTNVGWDYKR